MERIGSLVMAAAAVVALALCIYDFVTPATGIDGTIGAGLVIAGSATILLVALVMAAWRIRPRWLRVIVEVLLFLAVVLTGFAGYMLAVDALAGLMAVALLGWLIHLAGPARPRRIDTLPAGSVP